MLSVVLLSSIMFSWGQAHSLAENLNLRHGRKLYANPAVVNIGSTAPFAILAGTTVTNSGGSVVKGDLGLWAGSSITGFDEAVVTGHKYVNDPGGYAQAAHSSMTIAMLDAASRASNQLISTDLNGLTLPSGVYTSAGTMGLTGTLYLDAGFDKDACWIFQLGTSLSIEVGSKVIMINSNSDKVNVFWNVGSSAAIKTGAQFIGTNLAGTGISVGIDASTGPLLAKSAVTLLTNSVVAYDLFYGLPSSQPSSAPSSQPSQQPSSRPSTPTEAPTAQPTVSPSAGPSVVPSVSPSQTPSVTPSVAPSAKPTSTPSVVPSASPSITFAPSAQPSAVPSASPSITFAPSAQPSVVPSTSPSVVPSAMPSLAPSKVFAGVQIGANVTLAGVNIGGSDARRRLASAGSMLLTEESDKAIITAIATVLELPEDAVSIESERIVTSEDNVATMQIELRILTSARDFASYEACYGNYAGKLTNGGDAIQEQMVATAESTGAYQLYDVSALTVTNVENDGVVDTSVPDKDENSPPAGQFEGMIVGIVIGSFILIALAYVCIYRANTRASRSVADSHYANNPSANDLKV